MLSALIHPSIRNTYDQAQAFIYKNATTAVGYKNRNEQVVLTQTTHVGNGHNQRVYVLHCGYCGYEYGANGCDIFLRQCPGCRKGKPGLTF